MLLFLVLPMVFYDFALVDDFTCTLSQLRQSLPHLKVILSAKNYDKVQSLHDQLTRESNESNGKYNKSSVQIGSMIVDTVDIVERSKCIAALQIRYGYFSLTDARISSYLELEKDKVEKLRAMNRNAVSDMTARVNRMRDAADFNTEFSDLKQLYEKGLIAVKRELSEVQLTKLNALYQGYSNDNTVRTLLLRFMREKTAAETSAKLYKEYLPNMQLYMQSEGLILMDFKIARDFLGLQKEQENAVLDLYHDYAETVNELQLSLARSIGVSPDETIRFHLDVAMKLGKEYSDRFRKLLRDDQVSKVPQLLAQVLGCKYSFTPPIKQQIGITPEQDLEITKFTTKQQAKFPNALKNAGLDYEKQYQQELLLSKAIYDEMLTEEQRERWKKVTGKPIPENDLKSIRIAYLSRTNYLIKNPEKK